MAALQNTTKALPTNLVVAYIHQYLIWGMPIALESQSDTV